MQNAPAQPPSNPDYLTIAQLIVSGVGLALSLIAAFLLGLVGLVGVMSENASMPGAAPLFSLAWVGLLAAALAVPSLYFGIRRVMRADGDRRPLSQLPLLSQFRHMPGLRASILLMFIWPLALAIGSMISDNSLAWLFVPPLLLIAIGAPIWFILEMARSGLPGGSQQRGWGLMNFSVFLTTPSTVILEVIVFVLLAVAVGVWVGMQPELLNELEQISLLLQNAQGDPDAILDLVRPYLQDPRVIFGIIALLSGVTPLLEELLKPLGLWLLAGRRLTPAQGFVGGAVCGAAFALIESLMTLSNVSGGGWVALAVGRAGTGLLHIGTTAFVGWGLASAWTHGKYIRLALAYLGAAAFHGLWNALSLLNGLNAVLTPTPPGFEAFNAVARISTAGLFAMAVLMFALLVLANRRLRRGSAPEIAVQPGLPQPPEALSANKDDPTVL